MGSEIELGKEDYGARQRVGAGVTAAGRGFVCSLRSWVLWRLGLNCPLVAERVMREAYTMQGGERDETVSRVSA